MMFVIMQEDVGAIVNKPSKMSKIEQLGSKTNDLNEYCAVGYKSERNNLPYLLREKGA